MRQAKAEDWKITPLPTEFNTIALDILLSDEKSAAVKLGFIPEEMEEKWFCYFKDGQLFQHRSWSGHCIDVISFTTEGNKLRAVSVNVNRDSSQYSNTNDAEDVERITQMLDWLYQS